MKSPLKIPPFRIEIRDEKNPALWWPMEFAHSETHRAAKLTMRQAEFGEDNARSVPNEPHQPTEVDVAASKTEDRSHAAVTSSASPTIAESQPAAVPDSAPAAAPIPALPFSEGEEVEDEHSGARVRVEKIHAGGFDWVNLDAAAAENAKTGTCTHEAAHYFSRVKKAKAAEEKTDSPRSTPAKSSTPRAKAPRAARKAKPAHEAKTSAATSATKTPTPKAPKGRARHGKKKS